MKTAICLLLALLLLVPAGQSDAAEKQVTVCVLDSGCNLPGAEGWNFLTDSADIEDSTGHGTEICSLLQACAPGARLVMLKCFDGETAFDGKAAGKAMRAAVDQYGADVISISWTVNREDEDLHDAVKYAAGKGAILIASAGNISLSTGLGTSVYPAGWDEVIGVGGVNLDDSGEPVSSLWYLASSAVYVCARADWENEKGSSFAAPRVAAAVAASLAETTGQTEDVVRETLRESARDLGDPGYDTVFGWGYIENDH
jgi:subtilisin family serine protease